MELRYAILGENNVKWKLNIGHGRHVCLCIKMIGLSGNERIAIPLYGPRIDLKKIYIGDRDPVNQVFYIENINFEAIEMNTTQRAGLLALQSYEKRY